MAKETADSYAALRNGNAKAAEWKYKDGGMEMEPPPNGNEKERMRRALVER